MLKKDKLIQEKYNGIHPTCQCGCGQQTRYEAKLKDYCKWISGHQSRVAGHFGDPKAKKRVDAIVNTRKAKFASGEYNHILDKVSQNRSEETKQKISKGGTGVSRPKFEGFGIGRVHSQKTKDKMSKSAIERILKTGKVKRSGLEYKFEILLDLLEIKYIHSYYIESISKIYDFYLPEHNILIEIDGDFWHCNPIKHPTPECKTQEINIENDKFKSQWAYDNGYKLLRFWENDINNNIKEIKQTLLENTKA
jgi:very-short-patch-repair endonuclease